MMAAECYRQELDRIHMDAGFRQGLIEAMASPQETPRQPRSRRLVRTILIAAAVCAALTAGALAVSPGLREALSTALGSFLPYSQMVDGISVTDQGIRIKVVSVLADQTDGTAYVEVTDLTGDRLDGDVELCSLWRLRPISYDPEARTALFAVPLAVPINEILAGRKEQLELSFHALCPDLINLPEEERKTTFADGSAYSWQQGTDIPKALYTDQTLATRSQTQAESDSNSSSYVQYPVLVPNQTSADLGSPYFSLSSLGFDEHGSLHIQLALAQGYYVNSNHDLLIDIAPGCLYTEAGLPNGIHYRPVLLEDGRYLDMTFVEVTPEILEALPAATVCGHVYASPAIQGSWDLALPFEPLPETAVELNQPFFREGLDLIDARLTAMSFQLTFTDTGRTYLGGHPVHLFCKDGTILKLNFYDQNTIYSNASGETALGSALTYEQHQGADGWQEYAERDSWKFPRAVAPQDVAGFSFGLWYVPLDGSGTGYWLDRLPEATE